MLPLLVLLIIMLVLVASIAIAIAINGHKLTKEEDFSIRLAVRNWFRTRLVHYRRFILRRRKVIMPIMFTIFIIVGWVWVEPVFGPTTSAIAQGVSHLHPQQEWI